LRERKIHGGFLFLFVFALRFEFVDWILPRDGLLGRLCSDVDDYPVVTIPLRDSIPVEADMMRM